MPFTINGIGTMYYGKRNPRSHEGICESCKKRVLLVDYESTLFFVVLFIPLIPLGRKQLLNSCPSCQRHHVLSARKWQRLKQTALEESTAELAQQMDNPAAGLKHLYALSGFGELDEARDLAEALENQHAKDAEILFALGAWHEHCKQKADADRCFQAAYRLAPENPAMIRAQGLTLMEQGQLDEARGLLLKLAPPHPSFDPVIFSTLGKAFQERQRHAEALGLFEIAASLPEMRKNKTFQDLVRKSEQAVGRKENSLVPRLGLWQRKTFRYAALGLLLVGLWGLLTWVRGQNRTLHVINNSPQQLVFSIDGGAPVKMEAGDRTSLTLAEGTHRVTIVNPPFMAGEKSFVMHTPLWQRAFVSPSCILDPLQSSLIVWQKVWYRAVPDNSEDEADTHYGQLYVQYPGVDYLFAGLPREIRLRRGRSTSRTNIMCEPLTMSMLQSAESGGDELRKRAEQLLELRGFDLEDLLGYYNLCRETNQSELAERHLRSLQERRPVLLNVHRLCLGLAQNGADLEKLQATYDRELESDPRNPDLLYLRSGLESDFSKALPLLTAALEAAPNHGPSMERLIIGEFCTTQFERAGEQAEKYLHSLVAYESVKELLFAANQFSLLGQNIKEESKGLARASQAVRLFHQLGLSFSEPPQTHDQRLWLQYAFEPVTVARAGEQAGIDLIARLELSATDYWFLEAYAAYLEERTDKLGSLLQAAPVPAEKTRFWRFIYDLENGSQISLLKAANDLREEATIGDELLVAIRLQLEGEPEQAATWLKSAGDRLSDGDPTDRAWAELLRSCGTKPVAVEQVRNLIEYPNGKAIYATALAAFSASADPELIALAEKCNFDHGPPYRFLRGALQKLRDEK